MTATSDRLLQHYPRCFGCGSANERGLGLEVRWDGREAVCMHVPPADSEGGPGVVHGGYVGALVDEVMALVASEHAGAPAMTRRIELDLRSPTLVDKPLRVRAHVEDEGNRRVVVRLVADAVEDERVCFEAKGIFIKVAMQHWIGRIQAQERGPESTDWGEGDPSNFFRWQMRGGLESVYVPERASREVRVALELDDVQPPAWSIVASPSGVRTAEGLPADWDVRVRSRFRPWQELIHHSASLDALLAGSKLELEGSREALEELTQAIDFKRHS